MPSVFTHFLILDEATKRLPDDAADLINQNKEYAYWGSVGPDYFYFFEQDWSLAGQLAKFTFELYDDLEEIISLYNTASDFRSHVEDWRSGGLTGQVQTVAKRFDVIVKSFAAKFITKGVDFFEEFTPPISKDASVAKVNEWWLADLAHQRRTIDFSRSLWTHSAGDPRLRAYTLGYLTHVGGDASGHPVVNLLVGGPYRTQWRRHGLVEKAHDSHYWSAFRGQRVSNSHAHKLIEMQQPISPTALPDMPEELIDLISKAINENYSEYNLVNGLPGHDSINNMYRLYYKFLRSSSTLGGINMPPPEDFDWYDLPDWIRDQLQETWDRRPKGLPSISDPRDLNQWKALISGIVRAVSWMAEIVLKIGTLDDAAVKRLTTAPARYLLWLMEKAMYEAYQDLRSGLALGGFVHPEPEQAKRHFSALINPTQHDWDTYSERFGYVHYTNKDQTYHLTHPSVFDPGLPVEHPNERAIPMLPLALRGLFMSGIPNPGDEILSRLFLDGSLQDGLGELFEGGARFNPINGIPQNGPNVSDLPLPSAVAVSVALIKHFQDNNVVGLKNINLDGDRGYIWPTWESTKTSDKWTQYPDFKFGDW